MITTIPLLALILTAPALDADIRAVAALPGEPLVLSAAAVTRDEAPILTIEDGAPFDIVSKKLRLVIVGVPGGNDEGDRNAAAVLTALRWYKTQAPRSVKERWAISALPDSRFDPADKQSFTRWITFQAPDIVAAVGGQLSVDGAPAISLSRDDAANEFRALLGRTDLQRSSLHNTIVARVAREPLAIARLLAGRYPETPSISYIPALSWVNTLRVAEIAKDDSLREKVRRQTEPWVSGSKPLFGERIQLTAVAGTMIFAELGASDRRAIALADRGADLAATRKPTGVAEYGGGWTDDMFMASSVLARASRRPGRQTDLDYAARLLVEYAGRLQRPDGLFNHAVDGPAAWGRGNGFAAFGLIEALTIMPSEHPMRAQLLDIYRRHMAAVRAHQAPDGSWREVIDEPGAYREETATAMLMRAMARGIRLGWLDASYRPVVDRAWRAVAAHVAEDGTLIDVCASTGGGPTRRYYLDRPAITGADDRGGAMALAAAVEMIDLARR